MTDSKGKLTDPAWLKNELNWAMGTDAEMKEAMLNQWTEPHVRLEHKSFMRQRIRDQREDKSALNNLVNEFLDSTKRRRYLLSVAFEWMCCAQHPYVLTYSVKKKCRYCRPIPRVGEEHPIYWRPVLHPSK